MQYDLSSQVVDQLLDILQVADCRLLATPRATIIDVLCSMMEHPEAAEFIARLLVDLGDHIIEQDLQLKEWEYQNTPPEMREE